ncbi:glycosyltransferase family 2 protein [Patescibacteria group bacterium]|nr:glycosyltransferase family 2 protein [Patescibacteria group bacterium]
MPRVSINLVTWNGEKYIENCLNSIFRQTFSDFSLVLIDNGSNDKTLELIAERFPHLPIVKHKENLGFARAYNQTIHWSRTEYVLCLNQDVVLEPNYLEELVRFMDEHPQAGSVNGKILRMADNENTKYIDSVGLKIYKSYRVIDRGAGEVDAGQYDAVEEVFGISAAVPFYRRIALDSVAFEKEYFDEDFFSYKEDVDLAHRLRLAGWTSWLVPSAVAYHDRSVKTPANKMTKMEIARNRQRKSRFANFYSYRNHLYFIIKNIPRFNFSFVWPVFWYEAMKGVYVVFCETRNLRAWSDVIKNWKRLKTKRNAIRQNIKINPEDISEWMNQ